ncbi:MAG: DUF4097 family beta strand repeat protein [Nocardioidaceae bacterium]|nr:DUF4097 family beta strand repeat protein [Nocardioidaceae bacterium]
MSEQTATTTHEFETTEPVRLRVEAGSGEIRIQASDTDRTTVDIQPATADTEAAYELIARTLVEQRGDQVVVEVPRRGVGFLRRSPALAIAVGLPEGSSIDATADSADLRTTGPLGTVRTRSGSGDVLLDDVVDANVQSGSGETSIDRSAGSIRVQAASGRVIARTVGDGCWVDTASGDVRVESATGSVQVNTASGDVTVEDADGDVTIDSASGDNHVGRVRRGRVKITSASGDVHIGVVDGTPVWLDVTSLTGTVQSALDGGDPPEEGEDSVALRVNTVSGDITLTRS